MVTWQPISTAPKDGTEILASGAWGDEMSGAWITVAWFVGEMSLRALAPADRADVNNLRSEIQRLPLARL